MTEVTSDVLRVVGPTFNPDTGFTLKFKYVDRQGRDVYDLIEYPGLIKGEVRIPQRDSTLYGP